MSKKIITPQVENLSTLILVFGGGMLLLMCVVTMSSFFILLEIKDGVIIEEVEFSPTASEIFVTLEPHTCNLAYLGIYNEQNYGNFELFCEDGVYYGTIPGEFSLAMTEMKQIGTFNAVFCFGETCYAHPMKIEGDILQDVFEKYVISEKIE